MAVAILAEVPGLTTEMYDAVTEAAGVRSDPPAGLIIHTCGPMDGGLRIFDVWETRADYDRFAEQRLRPAMGSVLERHGRSLADTPSAEIYDLHSFLGS